MKQYLLKSIAVFLAACFIAFSPPRFEVVLIFTGDATSQAQVEEESLWQEITPITCNGFQGKPCAMKVDDSKLTGANPRYLNSSLVTISTIPAIRNGVIYYRPLISTGINSVINHY